MQTLDENNVSSIATRIITDVCNYLSRNTELIALSDKIINDRMRIITHDKTITNVLVYVKTFIKEYIDLIPIYGIIECKVVTKETNLITPIRTKYDDIREMRKSTKKRLILQQIERLENELKNI